MDKIKEKTLITLTKTRFYFLNDLSAFNQKLHIAKEICTIMPDQKIAAIKLFRGIFGTCLKESKDFIDAFSSTEWIQDEKGGHTKKPTSSESTLAMLENLSLQYDTCKHSNAHDIPF